MNKPDWNNAPEWASYLAMDSDGLWFWYEEKPIKNPDDQWEPPHGKVREIYFREEIWGNSLETRPE